MTELLKKAFDAASKLTPRQQNAAATLLLDEIERDGPWESVGWSGTALDPPE